MMTEEQKRILDERLDSYYANPGAGASWEEVKKRIIAA
jgi:putative addiction module component (TIGR02574 family)